ncbi:MAG: acetyl/propionyl/methylcrotonyl-CoA carboxylase subunit alpha [Magnetococcales bacterium]|nr:acetyl/propionyl/methylcrotonyl-CoA carboxylase subunit alpha [Magnetococcales bacterium]
MRKILIANRGEIACRIIKTARRMGIATVAIYSDADQDALHTRMADQKVRVGEAASASSYLLVDRILHAIEASGADAVHPGYGFLSENAAFCRTLQEKGITFIGPGPEAMLAMGDKIASKKLARSVGVNTIPGHPDAVPNAKAAVAIAREIGYPVMIKASAGGGGKGMCIARNDAEAAEGWSSAANMGRSYFKDDRVFVEKFIEQPRHIEIQILCDKYGHGVWLNERECSIQRRNQKVIEEAPSPFLDDAMRAAMGEQALTLAKAVGYVSAGTVEFVVGADRSFHFLEMNTRLQVEHPVTEMITGLDLVEEMIRIARGEPLRLRQQDVQKKGWAIECRIYAENPYTNFLPSTGRLVRHRPPEENDRIRVDTGVSAGCEVSIYYDPMIAKLITWGNNRLQAIASMREALDNYLIEGPKHNIDFLNALLAHPRFIAGDLTTAFIAEHYPEGFSGAPLDQETVRFFAIVAACVERAEEALLAPLPDTSDWVVSIDQETVSLRVSHAPGLDRIELQDGTILEVAEAYRPGMRVAKFTIGGLNRTVQIQRSDSGYTLTQGGRRVKAAVRSHRLHELAQRMPQKQRHDSAKTVLTPMPGLVSRVMVSEGQKVSAGQILCLLEAMKMENTLCAERDGIVATVHVRAGETVENDAVLFTFR